MALKNIPVLPENYPLFDWADWQSSRDALVKGGPTRRFASECWNAIVDTLADALEAAGLEWNPGGFDDGRYSYSVEDIKMDKDKRLKSSSMNRMLANIERIIRFGWVWEVDPSFRGYTGFSHFREFPWSDGKDKVYPEYIIELVRHLNFMLEIMRGTAQTQDGEIDSVIAASIVQPGLEKLPSASVEPDGRLHTTIDTSIESATGVAFEYSGELFSNVSVEPETVPGVGGNAWQNSSTKFDIHGNVRNAIAGEPERVLVHSKAFAAISFEKNVYTSAKWLAASLIQTAALAKESSIALANAFSTSTVSADIVQRPELQASGQSKAYSTSSVKIVQKEPLPTAGESASYSSSSAAMDQVHAIDTETRVAICSKSEAWLEKSVPLPTAGESMSFSTATAEAESLESLPAVGNLKLTSKNMVSMHDSKVRPTWVEHSSASKVKTGLDFSSGSSAGVSHKSKLNILCNIGSAWDSPLWHKDGLWIRQAYRIKIRPDGSMDLSGTGDAIGAVQPSMTIVRCVLDTAWLPPVWHEGGLLIRQSREVKMLEDGSLDLSGAGNELTARQSSRTKISCELDTAWLPPVMVDGGLFVRQSGEVIPYDNGELEVR